MPRAIPATLEGLQLTKKAARTGFDWDNADGIFDKLREETGEIQHALNAGNQPKVEEELGDLLFAAVNLARFLHVDPEIALEKCQRQVRSAFSRDGTRSPRRAVANSKTCRDPKRKLSGTRPSCPSVRVQNPAAELREASLAARKAGQRR